MYIMNGGGSSDEVYSFFLYDVKTEIPECIMYIQCHLTINRPTGVKKNNQIYDALYGKFHFETITCRPTKSLTRNLLGS